jgi:hypothetical protein
MCEAEFDLLANGAHLRSMEDDRRLLAQALNAFLSLDAFLDHAKQEG